MNTGYQLYRAERHLTAAEQREVDIANAHLAASLVRLWRALTGSRASKPAQVFRTGTPCSPSGAAARGGAGR